jgi:ribonuclease VapC
MVTFVLDASAVLRLIDNEAGADRMTEIFSAQQSGTAAIVMSAVNWEDVAASLMKRHGPDAAAAVLHALQDAKIDVIPATADRAVRSAEIKYRYKIPYADAFGVELASDTPDHVLISADFDFKPAASDITIEFLPPKP